MALTWSTDDQRQVLELHGKLQQEFGALGYQQGYQAESFGGNSQASLGLSGAGRLNSNLILIGEMSWDKTDTGSGQSCEILRRLEFHCGQSDTRDG